MHAGLHYCPCKISSTCHLVLELFDTRTLGKSVGMMGPDRDSWLSCQIVCLMEPSTRSNWIDSNPIIALEEMCNMHALLMRAICASWRCRNNLVLHDKLVGLGQARSNCWCCHDCMALTHFCYFTDMQYLHNLPSNMQRLFNHSRNEYQRTQRNSMIPCRSILAPRDLRVLTVKRRLLLSNAARKLMNRCL